MRTHSTPASELDFVGSLYWKQQRRVSGRVRDGKRGKLLLGVAMRISMAIATLLLCVVRNADSEDCYEPCANWWKKYLSSEEGNSWFDQWNTFIQAKLDVLAVIAEEREEDTQTEPYRVLMVGDSTMRHQFGSLCGFMAEREGRWFDPEQEQRGSPGCCMDTLSKEEGGGRGLCFQYNPLKFLDPRRSERIEVDAFYFGSGLHLLHMYPHWPSMNPMEPLRIQTWLNYESLLEGVVNSTRTHNGPDVKVAFMTNHVIADELYGGEYKDIVAAYREEDGNATIRAACQRENNVQVREASVGNPADFKYSDWPWVIDIAEYITKPDGEGLFTVDTYCEEATLDRRGSLQLSRRARPVMARLGVPIVDAARIVEGQAWASRYNDGRHFHGIVPIEVAALLDVLGAPPPPPSLPDGGGPADAENAAGDKPISLDRETDGAKR